MTIDPHNLGPALYKEEQVVTVQNLQLIINELMLDVNEHKLNRLEMERFDAAIATLTGLLSWIIAGKPTRMPKSGGQDAGLQ